MKTTTSGLQYQILKQGNGRRFQLGDTISYHLRLFDFQGNLLYDSHKEKQPIKDVFSDLSNSMGYAFEAFSMMPVGSRYKFFVPADLAFEDIDVEISDGKILSGGSVLVAEHELLSVKRPVEEMLKEEYRLDSILHAPIESELTMSFNEIKADSVFAITLTRSYDEKERTQVDLITSILYRESDGHFPIDAYRGKYHSYQQVEGSVGSFYYIPTLVAYQKVVRELEARLF